MTTYTLTVNLAVSGTPESNGQTSPFGHMWYSISNGSSNSSYGFVPVAAGTPLSQNPIAHIDGQGAVETNDNANYLGTGYTQTIQITQSQYNTLQAFGQAAISAQNSGQQVINGANGVSFSLYYNAFNNSCVNFTWAALVVNPQ